MKIIGALVLFSLFLFGVFVLKPQEKHTAISTLPTPTIAATVQPTKSEDPLTITMMQKKVYPGSTFVIEKTLPDGVNAKRFLVSYISDNLRIYGLFSVPAGTKPAGGWPTILFNHGYIPPQQYATEASYIGMVDPLSSAGYIVFKPDYRGNGNSEGTPEQPYVSPAYVTDSMNALASLKKYPDVNPERIGVMGHSMGGNITLHELVMTKDIKAAVIASGVVGDGSQLLTWWDTRLANLSIIGNDLDTDNVLKQMIGAHGDFRTNPTYWNSIDPNTYLKQVQAPVQIQVGSADAVVPTDFSTGLRDRLEHAGKKVDYIEYSGADHNLVPVLPTALKKAITFFDTYLK